VFLVLRVLLDEEPAAVRVEPRARLDDHPAHRQDAGAEVQVRQSGWRSCGRGRRRRLIGMLGNLPSVTAQGDLVRVPDVSGTDASQPFA
jgi:hypothetical protein